MSKSPKKNPPSNSQAPTVRKTTAQGKEQRDDGLGSQRPQNANPEGATQMPVGWMALPLSKIGTWRGGGTPSKAVPAFWTNGTIPWVSPKDMKRPKLSTAQDLITEAAVNASATSLIDAGSVLMVTRSGILSHSLPVAVNLVPVALNQDIKAITPSPAIDRLFLWFAFKCFERDILNECRKGGTTVHSIEFPALLNFTIPLPPLAEQHRIVAKIEELFSELDDGEESLRLARKKLGVYRQSLLKQAFEGKLTAQWRKQNLDPISKSRGTATKLLAEPSMLPQGWFWQTLSEVANISGGLTKNSKRDSLPQRIPYLRVANVYANQLRLEEIKHIGVTPAEAEKVQLVPGDLLIVEGNGSLDQIGRVAAWNGSILNCGHQNHLIRARCMPQAHYAFVLMFLLSPHGRDAIEKHAASTSGLHTLSVSKVQRLPVPLCSLPEQQEIVRLLDEQFTVIEQNEREIDAALKRSAALRQSILKKAFTGQLVPQDPTDEPASFLLERIRKERDINKASSPRKNIRKANSKP